MLEIDNSPITNTKEIANAFNSYFTNVSNQFLSVKRTELDTQSCNNISGFVNNKIERNVQFSIPPITTDFVLKLLKSMPTSKATGLDGFGVHILKISAPAIVASVTRICNLSIETGKFPDKWKEARISPIFKGGKRENCSNYRPVSVLPILSKILEKHVFKYLYEYLQSHNLVVDSQFGFRKNQSCQTALISLTEKMYRAISQGNYFGMVQLDLSKAFDLVNHSLLIKKLTLYRCDDATVEWFTSYLDSRSQTVRIEQSLSESQSIISGVPQGSILGPLLFLMYINDLSLCIRHSEVLLYADDTSLSVEGNNVLEIEYKLCGDVASVLNWCTVNDMVISVLKSSSMIVSTRQKLSKNDMSLNVNLENNVIPCVSCTKILGVCVDNVLSWDEHIRTVCTKIARKLYLLQQIKAFLPIDARKLFFNSYVLPHFDYCSIIWGNCSHALLYKLEKLQKRAARLILDEVLDQEKTTRSHVLFSKLGWMPVQDRITFHRAVQAFKCNKGLCDQGLNQIFEYNRNVHGYNTRYATDNTVHVAQNHINSFSHMGATTWNSLPSSVRSANSLFTFKQRYMKDYFSK
jgi:hypothetical protein